MAYEGKEIFDDEQIILTEHGERVRSKSEKIIADKLICSTRNRKTSIEYESFGWVVENIAVLRIKCGAHSL